MGFFLAMLETWLLGFPCLAASQSVSRDFDDLLLKSYSLLAYFFRSPTKE